MKIKDIPKFIEWLNTLSLMDSRIGVKDFNKLFKIYTKGLK